MLEKGKFNSIFDLVFNDLDDGFKGITSFSGNKMKLNVEDNDDSYVVLAELAGVDKKDIKIEVDNDVLKITAEKKYENNKNLVHQESYYGSLSRSLRLKNLDSNEVEASFENGLLSVKIKKLDTNLKKSIQIK